MSQTGGKPNSQKTPASQVGNNIAHPKKWLEPAVLVTLREWNLYGYKLMEQLAAFGFEAMNPGTMYRTLRRMEENGVVKSKWETSGDGPARRMYSIMKAGEAYLDFWANSLKQYQQTMDTFLRIYTRGPSRHRAEEKERG